MRLIRLIFWMLVIYFVLVATGKGDVHPPIEKLVPCYAAICTGDRMTQELAERSAIRLARTSVSAVHCVVGRQYYARCRVMDHYFLDNSEDGSGSEYLEVIATWRIRLVLRHGRVVVAPRRRSRALKDLEPDPAPAVQLSATRPR